MKKALAILMILCMTVMPLLGLAEEEKVVNVFSWSGYIDEVTLAKFEEDTGIKVIWSPMESMEDMLNKMHQGASGYDLIISSDYTLDILRQAGLIQKLDKSLLPNYSNLDPQFLGQLPADHLRSQRCILPHHQLRGSVESRAGRQRRNAGQRPRDDRHHPQDPRLQHERDRPRHS